MESGVTVSLMQPYFFPYLGYFELMTASTVYVHYDTAAFSRRGWQNRNRIVDDQSGWSYFGISVVKSPQQTPIKEMRLADPERDRKKLIGRLRRYSKAPNYEAVLDLVSASLRMDSTFLVDTLIESLEGTASYLGLSPEFRLASSLPIDNRAPAQQKVIAVCLEVGADRYLNLSGGRALYDSAAFEREGIGLEFTSPGPVVIPGRPQGESLSIVDTMMYCSPSEIRKALSRTSSP